MTFSTSRTELLGIVDVGVEKLREQGVSGEYGKEWLSQILKELRVVWLVSDIL